MSDQSFGMRLRTVVSRYGALCVGIDPHPEVLHHWGFDDAAVGAYRFGMTMVEAATGIAGVVKPQVAFFERFGSAGFAALEEVIAAARQAGLLVVADAKRGDIGSTLAAYGTAWLAPGSPLESDALTVNSFQGVASAAAVTALAQQHGKGLYFLAATSNPESHRLQSAVRADGRTVSRGIVDEVRALTEGSTSSIGVVVGATAPLATFGLTPEDLLGLPVLSPGFGRQGARLAELGEIFGAAGPGVLAVAARSLTEDGPDAVTANILRHQRELRGGE